MSLGLALALSSSLCWGVADFIGGTQARLIPVLRVILISQGVGLIGVVVLLVARGKAAPGYEHMLPAIGAGVAGIVALTAFYQALAIGTMSIVAPISATAVVVPVIVGIAGGDRPSALQLAGIAAATLGVVLASREDDKALHERRVSRASIGLALIAALGFGTFFVGLRASARSDVLWSLFAARGAGFAALVGAALALKPKGHVTRRSWLLLVAMGALDLSANGLYALATRHGLLSVVAVGASLYPLATVLLARIVLGERVRRVQELGIAAALTGVLLISAG
jgi:drug/metabolite transporter (DMT)-like permease